MLRCREPGEPEPPAADGHGDEPQAAGRPVAEPGGHPGHAGPQREEAEPDPRPAGVGGQERGIADGHPPGEAGQQQVALLPVEDDPGQAPAGIRKADRGQPPPLAVRGAGGENAAGAGRVRRLGAARAAGRIGTHRQQAGRHGDHGGTGRQRSPPPGAGLPGAAEHRGDRGRPGLREAEFLVQPPPQGRLVDGLHRAPPATVTGHHRPAGPRSPAAWPAPATPGCARFLPSTRAAPPPARR